MTWVGFVSDEQKDINPPETETLGNLLYIYKEI